MTHGVDLDEVLKLCGDAHPIALKPGEILFREGDEAESMYIVKTGLLRILSGSTMYETVGPGGLIGEMAIVEERMPRSATVIAGTYAELIEIDMPRFLSLVTSTPSFSIAVMRVISRRLRIMNRRYRTTDRTPEPD
jgi:CRP/FNR family transcriptional regulator, cyclic AMP receptor protein